MTEELRRWLLPRLAAYRNLDFFSQFGSINDTALISTLLTLEERAGDKRLQQIIKDVTAPDYAEVTRRFPYRELVNELELMSLDRQRVWVGQIRCAASEGSYSELLEQWARISRGVFAPEVITERWLTDRGQVDIGFTLRRARHYLHARIREGMFDIDILHQINRLIAPRAYQFCHALIDQTLYTFVLSGAEQYKLGLAMNWTFEHSGYFIPNRGNTVG
jgi:hypothetical protein